MKTLQRALIGAALLGCSLLMIIPAQAAVTVNVVDQNGLPIAGGFKWLLEQDNTHPPQPGVHTAVSPDVNNNTLALSIHRSHAPVVAAGVSAVNSTTIASIALPGGNVPLPPGRYFISVLPHGDRSTCTGTFDMGGAALDTTTNPDQTVTVYARRGVIETAQISVKVFHDILPLNNAPDVAEIDPANSTHPALETVEGFTVTLTEQAGDIVVDAFGNKLGTTYQFDDINLNGQQDAGEPYVLGADCAPIIVTQGAGDFVTPANGEVIIKNLAPGKYGVEVEPPTKDKNGNPVTWHQTTTIEGTKTIDAWVRPNEPPFLVEFGPPFWHAFYGFTKEFDRLTTVAPPGGPVSTVSGQVRKAHLSRPPAITFFEGPPPEAEGVGERCLVGLNRLEAGFAEAVWAGLCENETGNFTIPNVPPGTYQIVIWDVQLLHIISFNTVIVNADGTCGAGGSCSLGNFMTPMWFAQHEHNVFADLNEDGVRQADEPGIPEQNVNLRFRDGTIYKAFPTDTVGFVPFQAVFPFFHWLVAEVDFLRFKATGVTVINDDGGAVTNDEFGEGKRNPIVTTETGPVLLRAFQAFAGQNQRYDWGKKPYAAGENGGISGIVFYATTRAENDPRFAAGETWEPGIPRVQVNLYKDVICNSSGSPAIFPICPQATAGELGDGIPDPNPDRTGLPPISYPYTPIASDVDNHPLGWAEGGTMGPEDVKNTGLGMADGCVATLSCVFSKGDALRVAWTDSWDDNLPQGCASPTAVPAVVHGVPLPIEQCAEGLRTWNQAVPGVFDGGYAFGPNVAGDGSPELAAGTYIVETAPPPGYKLVKEEDRNVDFGPVPVPAILPAKCVGAAHTVPQLFSFLTTDGSGDPLMALPGVDPLNADNHAPFALESRPLCNRKKVDLGSGQNAATDFFLFTDVPKAARAVGLITDDFANELAPGKPSFTEKFSPPWISIAVFDYTGKEIMRTYGDEFGAYNFLAPSTYAINLPVPSGVGPKMHHFCLNHPGPIANGDTFVIDPRFRSQYSTTCYTFNFEAGRTTYLDTPVIRQAAFVGALQQTLSCEKPAGEPAISQAFNVDLANAPAYIRAGDRLRIRSMGQNVQIRNPAFPGDANNDGIPDDPPSQPEFINRDFGFGNVDGTVCIGTYCFAPGAIQQWNANQITVNVPSPLPAGLTTGQLKVTRANGQSTQVGLTVTVGAAGPLPASVRRVGAGQTYATIQAAIDAASAGDLILVDPGVYRELPIIYKRVRLQGAGAGSTVLWASHFSAGPAFENPLVKWRAKLAALSDPNGDGNRSDSLIGLLPEQVDVAPDFFLKDGEGPGIFVAPPEIGLNRFGYTGARENLNLRARIDGFKLLLADLGGAIYVNAYANRLLVSNNVMQSNAGNLGGAVRVGNPTVVAFPRGGVAVETSPNPQVDVRFNQIRENGSYKAGGGIAIYKGADNYQVESNDICGNFARSGGGGVAHRGFSNNGLIALNKIHFNEVFQGDQPGAGLGIGGGGGGIEVAGDPDVLGGGLTEGTGGVVIDKNLIQGNLGGASDGGGIALTNVNGADVAANPATPAAWHQVDVLNNLIVNNVSGLGGAGIALQDAMQVRIIHNTIARNDSTATSTFAFQGGLGNPTTPTVAGVISRANSNGLNAVLPGGPAYSQPLALRRNIFWQNRSYFWDDNTAPALQPNPNGLYWDIGVVGVAGACLTPNQSILTAALAFGCDYTGSNNQFANPLFVSPYFNVLTTAAAADEGGNFVQVYFTPLGLTGNYHIGAGSPAINALPAGSAVGGRLAQDIDGQTRPAPGTAPDTGADERY